MSMPDETQTQGGVGLPPGAKVGKYEVRQRLAIGGQSVLYVCHDPGLDRLVVIKQISSRLAEDPKFLERFRREAQILARLGQRQSAIVTIHELLEEQRGLFIVMEHVAGHTLETILQENPGPVEPKATLQILWRLAAALHDVHSEGIIHRDIKPANLIIGEGLRPKIMDFGVAASVTGQTSMLLGTTKYMAPELLSGETFDGRSDMYSLGFVTYEMLVGRKKFNEIFSDVVRDKHSESLRWMKWHSNPAVTAPAARDVNPAVPEPLSWIVTTMTAKAPGDRYENMEALGRAIRAEFSPKGKAAEKPLRRPRRLAKAAPKGAVSTMDRLASGGVQVGDEGDELEIAAEGPATAPLPKKKMSLRAKVILASATGLLVAIAAVAAALLFPPGPPVGQAKDLYDDAQAAYGQDDWTTAAAKCADIRKRFADTEFGDRASVMLPLCEGYLAVGDDDWETAGKKGTQADNARKEVNRTSRTSALEEWSGANGAAAQAIDRYQNYWLKMREFRQAMTEAQAALAEKRYEDARNALQGATGPTSKTLAQREAMRQRIDAIQIRTVIEGHWAEGDKQLANKAFAEAEQQYLSARDALNRREAKALKQSERDAITNTAAARLQGLRDERAFAQAMDEVAKAKNKTDELAAVRKVLALRDVPKLKARERRLKALIAFDEAQALEQAGKYGEARAKLVESIRIEETPEANAALTRVGRFEQREELIREGHAAYNAGKYAEAMDKYTQAGKKGRLPSDVNEKMRECRYRIGLAEADKLRDEEKYNEALTRYESLRRIKPEASSEIDARENALRVTSEYQKHMTIGEAALKERRWADATDAFKKAREQSNTPEVQARLDFTKYSENLSKGQAALESEQWGAALGYLGIAKGSARTKEEKDLVDALMQKAQAGRSAGG